MRQTFLGDDEGKHLEGEQALAHIHQVISEKFREIDEVIALPMTTTPQKTAEKKINFINLD